MAARWLNLRSGILAVSTAATVFLGVTYGAGLKTQQEWSQERQKTKSSALSVDEQIRILERQRAELRRQHDALDRKLDVFEERVREREAKQARIAAARAERER